MIGGGDVLLKRRYSAMRHIPTEQPLRKPGLRAKGGGIAENGYFRVSGSSWGLGNSED